jgi:cytochrome c peroxidase
MKRFSIIALLIFITGSAFLPGQVEDLRALYSRPVSQWPKPTIDSGVVWNEFASLPKTDTSYFRRMAQPKVDLGRMLFFDPVLSGSGQISCSSCHDPQTSWADHLSVPIGHDHLEGPRNTPSLLNIHSRKLMFWDGRANSLEEQAFSPIEAHHEMNMVIGKLPAKLAEYKGYRELFQKAYNSEEITVQGIVGALAEFQRTITSRRSRFDEFVDGKHSILNDKEIEGLHIFRTKGRCMNCHNGQFFTDEDFHNIGLTYYKRKYQDLGRYVVTKDPADVGKFRTPSLRDVMNTDPWMHNGLFGDIHGIINMYNSGMHMIDPTEQQKKEDPLYPVTDPLLKPLKLNKVEIEALAAFMGAITATQYKMKRPEQLPR